jgi:hypothetical protein
MPVGWSLDYRPTNVPVSVAVATQLSFGYRWHDPMMSARPRGQIKCTVYGILYQCPRNHLVKTSHLVNTEKKGSSRRCQNAKTNAYTLLSKTEWSIAHTKSQAFAVEPSAPVVMKPELGSQHTGGDDHRVSGVVTSGVRIICGVALWTECHLDSLNLLLTSTSTSL